MANECFNIEEPDRSDLTSSDEEGIDEDLCTPFELAKIFKDNYIIGDETALTLKKDYILSLCQDNSFTLIAAGLSNATVQLFDITKQLTLRHATVDSIDAPTYRENNEVNICGVRFLDETPNCLLVGTTNGMVRLIDLRTKNDEIIFENQVSYDERSTVKTINCFDRNANGRVLCTGTEQYERNVYIIFYDIRERKQLGGYFESHQDDITSVRFHNTNPDLLCSGSTDGLINIFDIKENTEDDALMMTINTESSVHKLNWHKNSNQQNIISCITHTNDFMIYDCEEDDEFVIFKRSDITATTKRKNSANCNLINAHNINEEGNNIFLLAGTNYNKGNVLRSLSLQNNTLLPYENFEGNKQIVRESLFDVRTQSIVTAGESGIVTLWTRKSTEHVGASDNSKNLKIKTKKKLSKNAPY